MRHRFKLRVYYEDTDFAGIVYYANYLRFIERARTEFVRSLGVDQGALKRKAGQVLVVKKLTSEFLVPARFDDVLFVETQLLECSGARIELQQDIYRDSELLFMSRVSLACVNEQGKPVRVPEEIKSGLLRDTRTLEIGGQAV